MPEPSLSFSPASVPALTHSTFHIFYCFYKAYPGSCSSPQVLQWLLVQLCCDVTTELPFHVCLLTCDNESFWQKLIRCKVREQAAAWRCVGLCVRESGLYTHSHSHQNICHSTVFTGKPTRAFTAFQHIHRFFTD